MNKAAKIGLWALALIGVGLIVASMLAITGYFDPKPGGTCVGGNRIEYVKHSLGERNVLDATFANKTGELITVESIEFGGDFAGPTLSYNLGSVGPNDGFSLKVTDLMQAKRNPYNGTISIYYTRPDGLKLREDFTCTGRIK